ncbi:hypothetical protein [Microvirga pudoricolor]|uniref:hypothetical protein n=1 Tax=Microvirga pudoricolor TaxID=2778729 RepID=UPI001950DA77|nr:hypothetical protein [Microvirga pudoricolor]MBM6592418.1 hypothetical protein [Microvirga pudoricolor]
MIIGLFALALAMIVGGLLSALFGWEIVLVERGWTMVIAGIVGASAGALLLGITAAVSRIAAVQAQLVEISARIPFGEPSASIATRRLADDPTTTWGEREPDAEDRAGGFQPDLPFVVPPFETPDREPVREDARIEQDEVVARPAHADDHVDISKLKLPDFLLERNRDTVEAANDRVEAFGEPFPFRQEREAAPEILPEEPAIKEPEADEFPSPTPDEAAKDSEPFPVIDLSELDRPLDGFEQPAQDRLPDPKPPEPDEDREPLLEPAVEADLSQAAVIGTYNSGDNRYVMFSDGSIEAETPQGNFRFASLDELKEFIASGGEGGEGGHRPA